MRDSSGVDVTQGLAERGRFEEEYEWRISTYTKRGIEHIDDVYRSWSETDGIWEAWLADEDDAFAALYALSHLQHSLFYAVGWASWVSRTQLSVDDPGRQWSPKPRDACERYFVQRWLESHAYASIASTAAASTLSTAGEWCSGGTRLRKATEPGSVRSGLWVECEVVLGGLHFTSASPTCSRALEFAGVYERLGADLERVLDWDLVAR